MLSKGLGNPELGNKYRKLPSGLLEGRSAGNTTIVVRLQISWAGFRGRSGKGRRSAHKVDGGPCRVDPQELRRLVGQASQKADVIYEYAHAVACWGTIPLWKKRCRCGSKQPNHLVQSLCHGLGGGTSRTVLRSACVANRPIKLYCFKRDMQPI